MFETVPSSQCPGTRPLTRALGLALAGLLGLTACLDNGGNGSDGGAPTPLDGGDGYQAQEADEGAQDPEASESSISFPDDPAGELAEEIFEILNAEQNTSAEQWEDRLSEDFVAEVDAEEFAEILNQNLRPAAPWDATDYEGDETSSVTRLESEAAELDLQIGLAEDGETIETIFFAEPFEPAEPADGFEEIAERLEGLPGEMHAVVLEDGEPLLEIGQPHEPAPLASTAKLYVILALAESIEEGDHEWLDELELTEDLRSLPSGTLQDQPEGYTTTISDVAQRTIEVSDNTGTDMLIDLLGREAVEDAVVESGHSEPELLQPFLTTRELFQLRWGHPELSEDWEDLDEEEQRERLTELEDEELDISSDDTGADDVDFAIDWHASAYDIVAVHEALAEYEDDHPELSAVLGTNPGLAGAVEEPWWDTLAFKGGGLPGVLTGSWHAVAEDGTTRTVVLLAQHDEALGEHRGEFFQLAQDALTIGTESEDTGDDEDEDDDAGENG
ncbi:serine hydrolase [Nesterenkonia populi]